MDPFNAALVVESPHVSLDGYLEAAGLKVTRLDKVPDEATLIEAIRSTGAQVLFKRSRVPVTDAVIRACPSLHAVQLCCIGTDSVDLAACAREGVLVFNDPISNGRSVVELAIGHLVALSRRLYETDVQMHANTWQKSEAGRYEILGKTLGIVGLGNIGRQVARAAEAMGMRIRFYDNRLVAQEVGAEMGWHQAGSLVDLFRTSDMVTVHTSAKDAWDRDNAGLLDPVLSQLGAELPDGPRIFLNLARGNLHSSEALLAAVRGGAIRYAAVDVFPDEPAPGQKDWQNPYADEPRVSCTPHIGASTLEAQPRIARRVATTVERFAHTGALRDCVFEPRALLAPQELAPGQAVLSVVHSVSRGTKKAVDDAIYEAEVDNLGSMHRDFPNGVAYDLSVLDRPLGQKELEALVTRAASLAHEPGAIRSIRQVVVRSLS
ncbi:MAG: 3-phosphoglycerate dehydrogenase [Alphaproteobacteria bacterium]|nr:3-phosphoglycerate dehydrogenase [Alphaproteobacteria bacterium]MCB9698974.1 3-phosphoglycerate dehydrogenase [Alphaproteobacteria bacterium]